MPAERNAYSHLYELIGLIPPGAVTTYGRLARMTPVPSGARGVGWALSALRDARGEVPWWRVVSASGAITNVANAARQRRLLEAEGVTFTAAGHVDLARHLWDGRTKAGRKGR